MPKTKHIQTALFFVNTVTWRSIMSFHGEDSCNESRHVADQLDRNCESNLNRHYIEIRHLLHNYQF